MIDKRALQDDLIDAFINYQHRLDYPMPSANETQESIRARYLSDAIFNRKVMSLACGVMQIIEKHIE